MHIWTYEELGIKAPVIWAVSCFKVINWYIPYRTSHFSTTITVFSEKLIIFPFCSFKKESTGLMNSNKITRDALISFSKDLYQYIPNIVNLGKNVLGSHCDTGTCNQQPKHISNDCY